jgi:hypothetical protein
MKARTLCILGACLTGAIVILLPNLRPVRGVQRPSCINNLRQLQGAKQQWALEFHKGTNDAPTWEDLRPFLKPPFNCPQGGTYSFGRVGELPSCSIAEHTARYRVLHE